MGVCGRAGVNLIAVSLRPVCLFFPYLCLNFRSLLVNQINKYHAKLLGFFETETASRGHRLKRGEGASISFCTPAL